MVDLSAGAHLDLDAELVLRRRLFLVIVRLGRRRRFGWRAAEDGARPVSSADQPQRAAAAGEEVPTTSSKFFAAASKVSSKASLIRRSVSRIRPSKLAQRRLEVSTLGSQLLDVLERFLVLGLRERVDRAEAARDGAGGARSRVEVCALGSASSGIWTARLAGRASSRGGSAGLGVLRVVAGALRLHLAACDGSRRARSGGRGRAIPRPRTRAAPPASCSPAAGRR